MTLYKSNFKELGFYVGSSLHKFNGGRFKATNKAQRDVLDKTKNVTKVEEPKKVEVEPKKDEPKQPKGGASAKK